MSKKSAAQDDPIRKSCGFQRIRLGAHQARRVDFSPEGAELNGPPEGRRSGTWRI